MILPEPIFNVNISLAIFKLKYLDIHRIALQPGVGGVSPCCSRFPAPFFLLSSGWEVRLSLVLCVGYALGASSGAQLGSSIGAQRSSRRLAVSCPLKDPAAGCDFFSGFSGQPENSLTN